jgi:hypothetical protein
MEIRMEVSQKLKTELPYNYSGYISKRISQFIIQILACPYLLLYYSQWPNYRTSLGEWIKKMWHKYTVKYYLSINKNELMLFAGKWIDLEIIVLSEINQFHKDKDYAFSHMEKFRGKTKS